MSNSITAHVAYGIVLRNDGVPEEWLAYAGEKNGKRIGWEEGFLNHVLPEGVRNGDYGLEIVTHYLAGRSKAPNKQAFEQPILIVIQNSGPQCVSSTDGPADIEGFLKDHFSQQLAWAVSFLAFLQRCNELGIKVDETEPHTLMYLTWDDSPTL